MKIYLDDIMDCPNGMTVCRTAQEAIDLIKTNKVSFISFDHDLGTKMTGYDGAKFIEEAFVNKEIENLPKWEIHSANPVGAKRIQAAMMSAERFNYNK